MAAAQSKTHRDHMKRESDSAGSRRGGPPGVRTISVRPRRQTWQRLNESVARQDMSSYGPPSAWPKDEKRQTREDNSERRLENSPNSNAKGVNHESILLERVIPSAASYGRRICGGLCRAEGGADGRETARATNGERRERLAPKHATTAPFVLRVIASPRTSTGPIRVERLLSFHLLFPSGARVCSCASLRLPAAARLLAELERMLAFPSAILPVAVGTLV
jgi:hypothetical protein